MASWAVIMAADKATTWKTGQLVEIDLPDRGVEGKYLIQRITISPVAGMWNYRIDYGGRLLEIADFLKALVSTQQNKRLIEPAKSVQKYVSINELLNLLDEMETTTRQLPYECGDPDAECGMVVM